MKWVVTAREMRNIDERTINKIGIPGAVLMERAGLQIVESCMSIFGSLTGKSVFVFCGKGNNGGDGFVVAREMKRRGADVTIFVFAEKNDLKGDALQNYSIVRKMGIPTDHVTSVSQINRVSDRCDIIIDALLGTGIRGEVTGIHNAAIAKINSMTGYVVSVDMPSGLNTDTGNFTGECVEADMTVTMGLVKRGQILYPGKMQIGVLNIADIGFPERAISPEKVKTFLIEKNDVLSFLPNRMPYYYKGDCGRVLIIGGSPGMTGAPVLTAQAALKAGAGMTLMGIPESLNPVIEQKLTETMTLPLPETEDGFLSLKAEKKIMDALLWADILAIGPGIGRDTETIELIHTVLGNADMPVVIDADGLFAIAKKPSILRKRKFNTVITPHLGEFSRLVSREDAAAVRDDRIELVRKSARRFQAVLLLKGAPTMISGPGGEVFINSTGNAGMATAGSGDVLTGIISGLIGQGAGLTEAAVSGAYLHGTAGDLAADEFGEISITAGDINDFVPYAFEDLFGRYKQNES
ncbi:NAD(P)H-hydrate dehydratase [candidate division KSB1 bacterium]|nr:NAD(P)H-hydrate dehydratase [candidate division KSB1 bacterium]